MTVLVTGSGGLIGSEAVRHFVEAGHDVVGIENDMRAQFFGADASTRPVTQRLLDTYQEFRSMHADVRDRDRVARIVAGTPNLELIVHTAAQPSHDWAATNPHVDFAVNAQGTLNMLEAARQAAPNATFIYCSTSKVYGDRPNSLPLYEEETRLELLPHEPYYDGIDTSMSVDQSLHSLFGVSKLAADLLVQEYGRYFGMPTVCFRPGCLTGPAHRGAELHGFLAYLMRCTVHGDPYKVYGYGGKQVRCNIHAADVLTAFDAFHRNPRPGAVYNLGGGRDGSISMLEAIAACERISGHKLRFDVLPTPRIGDHRWWISDLSEFRRDYPDWGIAYSLERTLTEIHAANV